MESVGIIGTGTKAAIWYYETVRKIALEKMGEAFIYPVKLVGVPFAPINAILPYQIEKAGELMIPYFREIEAMDCRKYILANITMHEGVDMNNSTFHPTDAFIGIDKVFDEYLPRNSKNIMIVGTAFTMKHTYIPNLISTIRPELSCVIPDQSTIEKMDELRRSFYEKTDDALAQSYFNDLQKENPEIDLFVIACTEHAIALKTIVDKHKFFNLPYLQCLSLVEHLNH